MWPSFSSLGFVKRQPSEVSKRVPLPRGYAFSGRDIAHGARVIDSTPPATNTWPSPATIARAAWVTASSPEPHSRFTVAAGIDSG